MAGNSAGAKKAWATMRARKVQANRARALRAWVTIRAKWAAQGKTVKVKPAKAVKPKPVAVVVTLRKMEPWEEEVFAQGISMQA